MSGQEALSPALRSTVDEVVAELRSAYQSSSSLGPYKIVSGVRLDEPVYDVEQDRHTASLIVSSNGEGMHADDWSQDRRFAVTGADILEVARADTPFRQEFEKIAARLGETREAAQNVVRAEREAWYQAGLPVDKDVTLLRPLRFRPFR